MRIKDEIFCFAHLRWCHNGWASNILIVVDTGYAGIHHSKYWMPIHYDTIEDGQNKKSHLLFSKYQKLFWPLFWNGIISFKCYFGIVNLLMFSYILHQIYWCSPTLSQISLKNSFGKVFFQILAKIEMSPNKNQLFGHHFETVQHFNFSRNYGFW